MLVAVEPRVVDLQVERRVGQQLHHAADVIAVDVRDDHEVEAPAWHRLQTLEDGGCRGRRAGVDQHGMYAVPRPAGQQQGVALLRGKHVQAEARCRGHGCQRYGVCAPRKRWSAGKFSHTPSDISFRMRPESTS